MLSLPRSKHCRPNAAAAGASIWAPRSRRAHGGGRPFLVSASTCSRRTARALRLTPTSLEIWDGVEPPNRLRTIAPQIDVAIGYGRIVGLGEPSRDTDTQPAGLRAALSPDACNVA